MACGGCRKNGGTRHTPDGGDLQKYAYLSPRQLRYLRSIGKLPEEPKPPDDPNQGKG